jgi:hypothetical protein
VSSNGARTTDFAPKSVARGLALPGRKILERQISIR